MARDGTPTRNRILDTAETLVLERGFGSTSIDDIVKRAGITKGTFFYHFENKASLANALLTRYAERDVTLLRDLQTRADKLSRDPREQLLIFVGLLIELTEQFDDSSLVGCLFASYCYEQGLFDEATLRITEQSIVQWRKAIREKLDVVTREHPPKLSVDLDSVADLLTVILEGAYVFSRSLRDTKYFSEQLRHYRNYLELLL